MDYTIRNNDHDNHDDHNALKELLKAAVEGETADFAFYNEMANMVENDVLKSIILGVGGDEYGHARTWRAALELFDCIKTY